MTKAELARKFDTPEKRARLRLFLVTMYAEAINTMSNDEILQEYLNGNDGMPTKEMQEITKDITKGL